MSRFLQSTLNCFFYCKIREELVNKVWNSIDHLPISRFCFGYIVTTLQRTFDVDQSINRLIRLLRITKNRNGGNTKYKANSKSQISQSNAPLSWWWHYYEYFIKENIKWWKWQWKKLGKCTENKTSRSIHLVFKYSLGTLKLVKIGFNTFVHMIVRGGGRRDRP